MRERKFRAYYKKHTTGKYIIEGEYTFLELLERRIKFDLPSFVFVDYTGSKDKNGEEIYEGDIIRRIEPSLNVQQVEYCQRYSALMRRKRGEATGDFLDSGTISSNIGFEIIGNIYQNPELLTT